MPEPTFSLLVQCHNMYLTPLRNLTHTFGSLIILWSPWQQQSHSSRMYFQNPYTDPCYFFFYSIEIQLVIVFFTCTWYQSHGSSVEGFSKLCRQTSGSSLKTLNKCWRFPHWHLDLLQLSVCRYHGRTWLLFQTYYKLGMLGLRDRPNECVARLTTTGTQTSQSNAASTGVRHCGKCWKMQQPVNTAATRFKGLTLQHKQQYHSLWFIQCHYLNTIWTL